MSKRRARLCTSSPVYYTQRLHANRPRAAPELARLHALVCAQSWLARPVTGQRSTFDVQSPRLLHVDIPLQLPTIWQLSSSKRCQASHPPLSSIQNLLPRFPLFQNVLQSNALSARTVIRRFTESARHRPNQSISAPVAVRIQAAMQHLIIIHTSTSNSFGHKNRETSLVGLQEVYDIF